MSRKALVVDNDFFFVEFLTELLEARGFEVEKAYDGEEGMAKLEAAPFELMFVDMVMPKVDGKELIQFARRRFPDNRFPIIALSGILIEQLGNLDQIGADYFVAKGPMEKMAKHVEGLLDDILK